MKIPFVDLKVQYAAIREEIDAAIRNVIEETAFIRGKFVEEFERAYAEEYGAKHCVSCANGTDAIFIVLKMLGIGPGDEVITTANSWISTSETISLTGAQPVFVDVEEDYYDIDPALIAQKITPRTKAILPVHLLGQPADMEPILALCHTHKLFLIEDCAQAHLAEYRGQRVGTFGVAGTFSFYPGKNLGAYGDAGAIVTNNDEFAVKCRVFANHGADRANKHDHQIEGICSRMDGLQAAILKVKLPHLSAWTEARRIAAARYDKLLTEIHKVTIPKVRDGANPVYHVYCVRVRNRNALQEFLKKQGIDTARHYPTPLPLLTAYKRLGHRASDFPVVTRHAAEILSLPIFPEITEEQQAEVVNQIRAFYAMIA